MDGEEVDQSDNSEAEDLRQLILERLIDVDTSEVSDEESFQIRLSCIIEDDESESSVSLSLRDANKQQIPKNEQTLQKSNERDKIDKEKTSGGGDDENKKEVNLVSQTKNENENIPSETSENATCENLESAGSENVENAASKNLENTTGENFENTTSENFENTTSKNFENTTSENFENATSENLDNTISDNLDNTISENSENVQITDLDETENFPTGDIKKFKSSHDLIRRPFVLKRRETSTDSSDLDISIEIEEIKNNVEEEGIANRGENEEKVSVSIQEDDYVELEVVKNESDEIKDETVPEEKSTVILREGNKEEKEDEEKKRISFRDVHIRGVLHKEYNPPIPPETYLWEEIKRRREKGGYPWTYLDNPPMDEETWKKLQEHEYEPINPPPQSILKKTDKDQDRINSESSIPETDKHFVRIPLDEELVIKDVEEYEEEDVAMAEEAKSPEDVEVERLAAAQDLQDHLENRYLAATPTTTASRTDCDVNTSMLDSSGLEDLPLNRGSRNKKAMQSKTEQMRAQAQGIHQKLRSQAGKLRNKLRNIPRPSFHSKEKSKPSPQPEAKPEATTSRKKTERPRFSLPERPKFKLPERPKFNLPERPKINIPGFGKSKTARERPAASISTSGSKKNIFDIDFKTSKIFSKKSKQRGEYMTSSPKQTRGRTPPPIMRSQEDKKKDPVGQKWIGRFDDIKYADADMDNDELREYGSRRSEKSESVSDFRDKDLGYTEDLEVAKLPPGRRTISTKSSLSHLSDREIQSSGSSEDRLRKGVLEEIDSDEFFLRQKGISQEDIDMGKYLSHEIREAFRSPVVNALAQMDYDYDDMEIENIDPKSQKLKKEPNRPGRTRSLKKRSDPKKAESEPSLNEADYYKTYPPHRPTRRSRSKSKGAGETTSRYENEVLGDATRYENVGQDQEDNVSEYYKSPGSVKEYQHYKVPRADAPTVQPVPMKRKSSSKDTLSNKKKSEGWVEIEIETSVEEIKQEPPPQPLTRRKSRKQRSMEEWVPNAVQDENTKEPDYIIPAAPDDNVDGPPIPPKRTRSMSKGSRSLHSLKLEDDKPQQRESTPAEKSEAQIERVEEITAPIEKKQIETKQTHHYELSGDEMSLGYATVGKSTLERPERNKKQKPQRPPPPRKKRDLSSPSFSTLPKRVPVRPMRNYSTLGPSRPPRRHRTSSVEHLYAYDRQSQAYVEITDDSLKPLRTDDLHGSTKDLQTEEVIEKMKGRPLPPPPRPPRQKSRGPEDKSEEGDYPIVTQVAAFVHEPPPGTEIVEEVCVSTQTDPLPDDLCLENEEDFDMIQELSHEQLRIQEAFLEEMKKEEERIQAEMALRRNSSIDVENDVITKDNEVIKQLEEMVAEERKLFEERQKTESAQAEDKRLTAERLQREREEQRLLEEQKRLEEEARQAEKRRIAEEMRIAEERRLEELERLTLEVRHAEERRRAEDEKKAREEKKKQLEVSDVDMGYASLDRREINGASTGAIPRTPQIQSQLPQPAPMPIPVYVPVLPDPNTTVEVLKTEKLEVKQLDVERLNVNELNANRIQVHELQSTRLTLEDMTSRTGNLTLGSIELPPDFIQQIIARIPWEEIRIFQERSNSIPQAPTPSSTPVESVLPNFPTVNLSIPQMRPSRRHQNVSLEESEEENVHPVPRRTHRRLHGSRPHSKSFSSDEEEGEERRELVHRRHRASLHNQNVLDLSKQLARACTSAGLRAVRNFAEDVRTNVEAIQTEDKAFYMQAVLCVLIILIAGFFLLGFDSKAIYHYHWDFQFPPRPPPQGL